MNWKVLIAAVGLVAGGGLCPARAEVILEDKGPYKKDIWHVEKRYDDLDTPNDRPGVVTSGRDPLRPSGPAVDFEERPGAEPSSRIRR